MFIFDGLEVYRDFIDYVYFLSVMINKPVLIISGFCHADDIYRGLLKIPHVTNKYQIYCFSYDVKNETKYSSLILNRVIERCDVYVCNKNASDLFNFSVSQLPSSCKIIRLPIIRFFGIWPQINPNHTKYENAYYVQPVNKYDGAFIGGDVILNAFIENNESIDEILRKVTSLTLFQRDVVYRRLMLALRQIEYSEEDCDFSIVPYVKSNYQRKRLFKDYLHIANPIVIQYIFQLCQKLDMHLTLDLIESYITDDLHVYTEMPVYPAVADILNIEWVSDDTRYCIRSYNGVRYVDFLSYVKWYCEYTMDAKNMRKWW